MNVDLSEGLALEDGTRVFSATVPGAGTLTAFTVPGFTSGYTLVTSVKVDAAEKLPNPLSVTTLYARQNNGTLVYGAVAQGTVLTVLLVGDADGVSATIS